METKKCKTCEQVKNVDEFPSIKARGKTYKRGTCYLCKNEYQRDYTEKNKESVSASKYKYVKNLKIEATDVTRKCTSCNEVKKITKFRKRNDSKCGYTKRCNSCISKKYIEKKSSWDSAYYEKNSERFKESSKDYRQNNPHKIRRFSADRRARELKATPKWLTKEHFKLIDEVYKVAQIKSEQTGLSYHVDHIVPLKGKTVTGLHVPWNLRVITAEENIKKSNKLEGNNGI